MTTTPDSSGQVTVRYWAGARAAAGVGSDLVTASTVGQAVEAVRALHPALEPVLAVASFLVDGAASGPQASLAPGGTVEVLPPFAGG